MVELQRQLELKDTTIASLRRVIEQKDELLAATEEKLKALEEKRDEIEEALISLTIDANDNPEEDEIDTFVTSNSRAAQLETEKNDLRVKLATLSSTVVGFCTQFRNRETEENNFDIDEAVKAMEDNCSLLMLKNSAHKIPEIPNPSKQDDKCSENVQLQVRMELEHERRLRTQAALDESEKKHSILKSELERKDKKNEELVKQISDAKEKCEVRIKQVLNENERLERLLKEKEVQISQSESKAKELSLKAEEFEELFNVQLSSVKALQSDLQVSSSQNKSLVKEMEMLNQMFNTMERQYVVQTNQNQRLSRGEAAAAEASEEAVKDSEGREIVVDEVLKAVAAKEESINSSSEESCFREVTTKNGTRMVLSLSKTFMKLKDLILEKKQLTEQVEKMKAINVHLNTRVNSHEEKLFNISDELNKTWSFVSTLKQQHRQLHESEQILRAELSEKRQLLAKLREELEYSRESWNVVKQKTADSEREWHALRAEFASRRKLFKSAYHLSHPKSSSEAEEASEDDEEGSESGFSSTDNMDLETDKSPVAASEAVEAAKVAAEDDPMTQSTITIKNEDENEASSSLEAFEAVEAVEADLEANQPLTSILIPPLDFIAQVPPSLFPPLLPKDDLYDVTEDEKAAASEAATSQDGKYCDLYQNLIASSARSAALANRLAEMHRTNGSEAVEAETASEDDYEPQTEEDSIIQGATSPEIISEIASEVEDPIYLEEASAASEDSEDEELEDLGLSPEAIEQALANSRLDDSETEDEDETSVSLQEESEDSEAASELAIFQATPGLSIPAPPPLPMPPFSLIPPPATVTVRPTYNYANLDSEDDSSEDEAGAEAAAEEASENATSVTRFLIKHLPKQLSTLRQDKIELEEKIRDLETLISNQNVAMNEMERRIEVYKKEAEMARKWSASLANLHHIKVNTLLSESSLSPVEASTEATTTSNLNYEWVELPVTVTKAKVKMMWKILCSEVGSPVTGFVAYRLPSSASMLSIGTENNSASSAQMLATYILSGISLHPSDFSEIEVKAQKPGLYILQLRATRLSLSDITYEFSIHDDMDEEEDEQDDEH